KWCEKHEAKCFHNPINARPCFDCVFLDKGAVSGATEYHYDGSEYSISHDVLMCAKRCVCIYPPHISEPYELLGVDNVSMPLTCNGLVEK
ncbi:MAG: hypothetical protein KAJ03_10715, partial [Gammaproteobacteria bacterium]|nr:hypothetical protein [Gammaproteobacteria bacterium]